MKRAIIFAVIASVIVAIAGVNRNWGLLDGQKIIYAPDVLTADLKAPNDADYEKAGYLHVEDTKPEPPTGFHVSSVTITNDATRIYKVYAYEKDIAPVKVYSKLRAIAALEAIGKWDAVKAWIEAAGLTDKWVAANDLESDYDGFDALISKVCSDCGITDEQKVAVMDAAEVR